METLFISIMKASNNRLTTIKRIMFNSNMLAAHKARYAVKLINLARQHNLL